MKNMRSQRVSVPSTALLDEFNDYFLNAEVHNHHDSGTCWVKCDDVLRVIAKFTRMVARRKSNRAVHACPQRGRKGEG